MKGRASGVRYIPIALLLLAFVLAGCFGPSTPTPTTGTIAVTSEPAGANVFLDDEDTGKTTNTELKDVKAGNHTVTLELNGYKTSTKQVAVTAGKTVAVHFDLELDEVSTEPGKIAGTVTGSGGPLVGATVTVSNSSGEELATTDEDGAYSVTVSPGAYTVKAEADGYHAAERSVTVLPEETTTVDFALVSFDEEPPAVGYVHGTVTEGLHGGVLEGASITVYDKQTGDEVGASLTDADGDYSVVVPFGEYEIVAEADGYVESTKTVTIATARATKVSFELDPLPAVISGNVIGDEDPEGIKGATVIVTKDGELVQELTTDENGFYSVSVVAGTYEISVSAKYYYEETDFVVTVGPGEKFDASFHLNHIGMAEVSGFVSENRAGRRLPGVTVTAYEAGTGVAVASTVTDGSGFYFLEIPIGTYDIVTDKAGQAQGKRQALTLDVGEQVTANLISKPLRDLSVGTAVAPDLVVLLEDEVGTFVPFEPGIVIDPTVTTRGLVQAITDHDMYRIKVWIGHQDDQPDFQVGIANNELVFDLGDLLPPLGLLFDLVGETELIVAAYDYQNNWTEVRFPFVYEVGEPSVEVGPIDGLDLIAFTYGHDLGLYLEEREQLFASYGIAEDPTLFDLGDGTMIDLSRLDKDVTMYTVLRWEETFYEEDGQRYLAEGYEIERSFHHNGPWTRLARVGYFFQQPYIDTSPELEVGKPVYYRVRGVGPNGETGPWSVPLSVTPLDRFEIMLVDPADDATNVSLTPTLRWEHTEIGADEYMFDVYVAAVTGDEDAISGYYTWYLEDAINITEAVYNFDGSGTELLPAHTYMWNVIEGRAYAYYRDNSRAVAFPWTGPAESNGYSGAANGAFLFTTTHEQ